jgi:hypothetical protein
MTTSAPVIKEIYIPEEVPQPEDIPLTQPQEEPVKVPA